MGSKYLNELPILREKKRLMRLNRYRQNDSATPPSTTDGYSYRFKMFLRRVRSSQFYVLLSLNFRMPVCAWFYFVCIFAGRRSYSAFSLLPSFRRITSEWRGPILILRMGDYRATSGNLTPYHTTRDRGSIRKFRGEMESRPTTMSHTEWAI